MEFDHRPVMLGECIEGLNIRPDGIYIDGTCGGAGHSEKIAEKLTSGRLLGIDRDPEAVSAAKKRLEGKNAEVVRGNFSDMTEIARSNGIEGCDGILLDLGVSSHQLDDPARGFSFHNDAPLDMRMSMEGTSAADLVNSCSEEELKRIIFKYGEEKFAGRIASGIVSARLEKPIETTAALAEIIKSSVPAAYRREKNPCRKTFQALRIAVNGELDCLDKALDDAFELLNTWGRLCVISFHSLEDRMVKQRFADFCRGCVCPPDFPVCVCGRKPRGKLIAKKPLTASESEMTENPRSRSAKLRIIEKTEVKEREQYV